MYTVAGPVVKWRPDTLKSEAGRALRWRGAVVGFAIGSLFAAGTLPSAGPGVLPGEFPGGSLWTIPATLIGGTIGGWSFGPAVATARGELAWAGLVFRLGALAMFIGALVIGEEIVLASLISASPDGPVVGSWFSVIGAPFYGVLLGAIGAVTFGLFVLPVTVVAAILWAIVMRCVASGTKGAS